MSHTNSESRRETGDKKPLIVYFVRTNTMQNEARVARLFRALSSANCNCVAYGVVKHRGDFDYAYTEYVASADRITNFPLRIIVKFFEVQRVVWRAARSEYKSADIIIIANHEFLPVGILLRLFGKKRVVVDLHEHYYEKLFHWHWWSNLFFTRIFSGVIFANRKRAEDFMGESGDYSKVTVARNFPDASSGDVLTPAYSNNSKFQVAIVGGAVPGRYVRESIRALDQLSLANKIEIHTFGPEVKEPTSYVNLKEHGMFKHWEIESLLEDIDGSLVFYDPSTNGNNRLCEPNRFFQAYNLGKIIFTFDHPSISEFFDKYCRIISQTSFADQLCEQVVAAANAKEKSFPITSTDIMGAERRRLLTYDDGLENLENLTIFE